MDIVVPIETFDSFNLDPRLAEALDNLGLTKPTPIQAEAVPFLLEDKDVLGLAQTGTGKTIAFVLPILQKILALKGAPEPRSVRAVILAPTRELANQIAETVRRLSVYTKMSCQTVVGGVKAEPQIRALKKGQDVVVATPGRLEDHLRAKVFSLKSTAVIVLDEADQMLDMGFIPAVRRIMAQMPRRKQAALFSATMPIAIKDLAAKFMYRAKEVSVAAANRPVAAIEQIIYAVAQSRKQSALIEQLSKPGVDLALVFVKTKRGAERVQRVLDKAGIASQTVHGDRSQGQRDRALKDFRDGRTRILVATDVAARGIDVPAVTHVFNFDLPQQAEAYVHRIGRTARAGASGVAITFMNPTEREMLGEIERFTRQKFKIIPLKVADQAADLNAVVQAEQATEEREASATRGKEQKDGAGGAQKKSRDEQRRQAQGQQAFLERNSSKKKRPGQRTRRREKLEGDAKAKAAKPHFARLRDADKDWEASFESDMKSADGLDSARKPTSVDVAKSGKATQKARPKGQGKANKPNSKKGRVAKEADKKRRNRHKAAQKPVAKPRGFIKSNKTSLS